ncbi:3529_t:CDS:2 [Entrophospora sp. SA101]|nr:3529_t:CDS:2 [Entrophospora sp. SA101]
MSSKFELLKQCITELEAENPELREENTEISNLRIKLSVSDAEIAELKHRNAEVLRVNGEYNERRDAENAKLKARIKELEKNKEDSSAKNVRHDVEIAEIKAEVVKLRDNNKESKQLTSHQSEEKETDAFLNKMDKKRISDRIRQRNREKKLQRKNEQGLIQEINSSMKEKHILSAVTEISANQVRPNSLAERNEEEETLHWCFYAREFKSIYKDFIVNNKVGEKKAKGQITKKPDIEFIDEEDNFPDNLSETETQRVIALQ